MFVYEPPDDRGCPDLTVCQLIKLCLSLLRLFLLFLVGFGLLGLQTFFKARSCSLNGREVSLV